MTLNPRLLNRVDSTCHIPRASERVVRMLALRRDGWTLQRIADELGVTPQAVSLSLKHQSDASFRSRKKAYHAAIRASRVEAALVS